jgi:uncharacterized repeat protein (TIGR01451 family)
VAFGNNVPVGTTVTQTITLTLDGGYRIGAASGGGASAPFQFAGDACATFTGPGTCTIKESFTPNAIGAAGGTLTVPECPVAGGACFGVNVALSGTGISVRAASPASVTFGNVVTGATSTLPIALTIDEGYRVSLISGGIASPFSVAFDTCGAGGGFTGPGTCSVNESFSPASAGPANGTLTIVECPIAGGSCLGVDIPSSGTGIAVLAITTAILPTGVLGEPFAGATLQTSGGTAPITWSIAGGALPTGMTLNPADGAISGTPTAPADKKQGDGTGVFTFTVAASDAGVGPVHQTATKTLSVTVLGFADLSVDLAAKAPGNGRKPVTFTITVRNQGPNDGQAIVTSALPAASTFVSAVPGQGTCTTPPAGSTGTVVCSLQTVKANGKVTIDIAVTPTIASGSLTSTASVAVSGAVDPVSTNNTATVTVQIK